LSRPFEDLNTFIQHSPTPLHAAETVKKRLLKAGYQELEEGKSWDLEEGGKYFVLSHGTTLAAFLLPKKYESALIVGSHTDSPALKIKPDPEYSIKGMRMLAVEVYGSPLLNSWLNRELSIAGTAAFLKNSKIQQETLILDDYPLTIPQLAIHLDREINDKGLLLNKQEHLGALFPSPTSLEQLLLEKTEGKEILGHDLFLYPTQPGEISGDYLSSYRLDNLAGTHAALTAFEKAEPVDSELQLMVAWDHEEIGSETVQGANSPFLNRLLERIAPDRETFLRLIPRSLCLSVDGAHAFHPSYPEKHEPRHTPVLGEGVALKHNANHRYATTASSSKRLVASAHANNIPLQHYLNRNDIPCGSTIGPLNATRTGIQTVDIGIPMLSMHSARELIHLNDHEHMIRLIHSLLQA